MTTSILFWADGFRNAFWELPADDVVAASRVLISWRVAPEPPDAGVPPVIAAIIAAALCEAGMVSWFSARGLVTTRDPSVAVRLFDEPGYDWTLRAQTALLSAPGQRTPDLDPRHRRDLAKISAAGFMGALLPGVDGDVAALCIFEPRRSVDIRGAMERACGSSGCEFRVLDESQLRAALISHP